MLILQQKKGQRERTTFIRRIFNSQSNQQNPQTAHLSASQE
jgi:hypothetical protein